MSSPTWQATRRRARRVSARPVLGEIRTAEAYRGDFILQIYAAILLFLLGLLLKPGGTPQVRGRRGQHRRLRRRNEDALRRAGRWRQAVATSTEGYSTSGRNSALPCSGGAP